MQPTMGGASNASHQNQGVCVTAIIFILGLHFLADFVFQTDWMAINKSKNWTALVCHIVIYFCILGCGTIFYWPKNIGGAVAFVVANCIAHFFTDAITSRITSYLWHKEKRHLFFVVIGADQYIHSVCLILTAQYFGIY